MNFGTNFIPIKPEHLPRGIQRRITLMDDTEHEALIRTALATLEFAALHPFTVGTSRIRKMLIPLMLWKLGILSGAHLFISGCLEDRSAAYMPNLRGLGHRDLDRLVRLIPADIGRSGKS